VLLLLAWQLLLGVSGLLEVEDDESTSSLFSIESSIFAGALFSRNHDCWNESLQSRFFHVWFLKHKKNKNLTIDDDGDDDESVQVPLWQRFLIVPMAFGTMVIAETR